MLARPYRLPVSQRLIHPRTVHTSFFLLKIAPASVSHSRAAVIISKAIDKRATKRNELRRIILHTIQPLLLSMKRPVDLLFILKKGAPALSHSDLAEMVLTTLQKEELL